LREQDASVIGEYESHGRVHAGARDEVLDAAHQAWLEGRSEGRSVVVMAADHATVDQLAMRARAARVAAGQVEQEGIAIGDQVVGVGDEVVTTKNDRRLVSRSGAWVRNGDRWQVLDRRPDGSIVLGSLGGRGKVNVPSEYARDNMALAYAGTVHKAPGITTDVAVLVVDKATTAEHLYVGLTRGRVRNLACAVTEPLDDGHRHLPAPTANDVLAAALSRSGAELSAIETVRSVLSHSNDVGVLRAVLTDALGRVDALAGRDQTREIELLQRKMGGEATGPVEGVTRLRALLDAQRARSDWLEAHPEVVAYVLDLAQRLRGEELRRALGGPTGPRADHALVPLGSSPEL
jgi:hypothetical protein